MKNKSISVITVCFNCKDDILKTINSLKSQKNIKFEHCIIDGGSTDGTYEAIIEYKNNSNEDIIIISEKDNGIYDAMNKGIINSSGDYIMFLNAGDILYSETTLYEMKNSIDTNTDIIYGKFFKVKDNNKVPNPYSKYYHYKIFAGRTICHQAILANRETFDFNVFDLKYKYASDYKWLLSCMINKKNFKYINKYICLYDQNGVSSKPELAQFIKNEYNNIIKECLGIKYYSILSLIKYLRRIFIK